MEKTKVVVLLSGGQDSATSLLWALRACPDLEVIAALSFDYGQRHRVELEAAADIANLLGVHHEILGLEALNQASPSALTRKDIDVKADGGMNGLPSTFTPGRNLVFLSLAASFAISRGARGLVTGVCQTDYSGYPDCRRDTIDALAKAINLGCGIDDFEIYTPLMHLTKAETVRLAFGLDAGGSAPRCATCWR